MRMIPAEISQLNPSSAEKKLFKQLAAVEVGGRDIALHSVNLSEHRYKVLGEIDFLLLSPRGLYVLEVKGGRVACGDGVWTFTDRYGNERRKNASPFEQARSALFSLLDRLRELGVGHEVDHATSGYGVVFPDQTFEQTSVEWHPAMVLDERRLREPAGLGSYLEGLRGYWEKKRGGRRTMDGRSVERVLRQVRPQFELVPTLQHRAMEIDDQLTELTLQQYHLLDAAADNDRLLCSGGAGTGKTLLALEVARRESAAGHSVLLTCSSPVVAALMMSGLEPGSVEVRISSDLDSADGPFDVLVVDEGQDLINLDDLAVMDAVLRGGLTAGRWRIFYDSNNQSGLVGRFDEDAFALLADAIPARLRLFDNCRNTRKIVDRTRLLTGADVGVTTAGEGPDVEIWFHSGDEAAAKALEAYLDRLSLEGVDPADIAILTGRKSHDSCVNLLPARWLSALAHLDTSTALASRPSSPVLASIEDFKGLERRFVAVVDVDGLSDRQDLSKLYVAMTRARAGLWLSLAEGLEPLVDELVETHEPLLDGPEGASGL